jgi:hypothetical protein
MHLVVPSHTVQSRCRSEVARNLQWERSVIATPEIQRPNQDSNSDQMQGPFLRWSGMCRAAALWGIPPTRTRLTEEASLWLMCLQPCTHPQIHPEERHYMHNHAEILQMRPHRIMEICRRDLKMASEEDAKAKKKA